MKKMIGILAWTVLAAGGQMLWAEEKLPNFVFFLVDDLGWADLTCYGSEYHETREIDKLAKTGALFSQFYAASPVCSPTRASFLTGKYPARVGVSGIIPVVPPLQNEEQTIAESLRAAGYVTASIGKWHLGGDGFLPEDQGFDINIGGTHAGMAMDFFYPAWTVRNKRKGAPKGAVPIEGSDGDYLTDRLTDEAVEFIRESKKGPFFLYLSHYAVHTPIQAKKEVIKKYRKKSNIRFTQRNPIYAAMIESIDDSLGRIRKVLEEEGVSGNTIIIVTSDNGGLSTRDDPETPATNNAPLLGGKGYLYEGGIRVPLIMHWPGVVKEGIRIDTPTISNDLFPTMVEIAGLPKSPSEEMDGHSLVPLLRDQGQLDRDSLYWHYPFRDIDAAEPGGVVRFGDYKLIEFYGDRRLELYNLKKDIGESTNLVDRMPGLAKEMYQKLESWRNSLGVTAEIE